MTSARLLPHGEADEPLALVRFEFGLPDLVEISMRTQARSPTTRRSRVAGFVLSVLVPAAGVYVLDSRAPSASWAPAWIPACLVATVSGTMYFVMCFKWARERLRRWYREQLGGDGPFTCEVELLGRGIVARQTGAELFHRWGNVAALHADAERIDLVFRGGGVVSVPDRAFPSTAERDRFREICRTNASAAGIESGGGRN